MACLLGFVTDEEDQRTGTVSAGPSSHDTSAAEALAFNRRPLGTFPSPVAPVLPPNEQIASPMRVNYTAATAAITVCGKLQCCSRGSN